MVQIATSVRLRGCAEALARRCGAAVVFVSDTSGWVHAWGPALPDDWRERCAPALRRVMDQVRAEGRAALFAGDDAPYVAARSILGSFVVTAVFDDAFPEAVVRAMFWRAIPEIESLLRALPDDTPPMGPPPAAMGALDPR